MNVKNPEPGIYSVDYFGRSLTILFSGREYPNNRHKEFLYKAGVNPEKISSVKQVHGSNIVRVGSAAMYDRNVDADGMICSDAGVALAVRTADCIPMFIWDLEKKVIGLAHIGWRGAYQRLASKMVLAFRQNFRSKCEDICVMFGPAIRACCYEVGSEFADYFPDAYRPFASAPERGEGGAPAAGTVDLVGSVSKELRDEGIDRHHVHDTKLCTTCRKQSFFSYRAENQTQERMLSVFRMNG